MQHGYRTTKSDARTTCGASTGPARRGTHVDRCLTSRRATLCRPGGRGGRGATAATAALADATSSRRPLMPRPARVAIEAAGLLGAVAVPFLFIFRPWGGR